MQASADFQALAAAMVRAASEVSRAHQEALEQSAPEVHKVHQEMQALRDRPGQPVPQGRRDLPAYREPREMQAFRAHLDRQARKV